MATTITINGSVTLDESLGLQNSGVAVGSEDNNDSDVSLATLQSTVATFYNRLFNTVGTGGLALSTTFATDNGVAESASDFITVSGGSVANLGFVDGSGGALPVYAGVATGGVATGLTAVNGGAISLFADATLGNRMVLGVDENNDIVFAIFMDPTADLTSARVWMVQLEAISNPDANNPDDSVNLFDSIGVAASTSLTFDFNFVHPGSNLFATVGDVNNALIVIAENPVIDPVTGLFSSSPNGVIKTSQGGGPTTIGVNSQMFDPGEGAYFTYVNNPDPNYLAGATNGLSPTEANDADNILYSGGTNTATSASTFIVQTQGGGLATMAITAFDIADSPQAKDFVSGLGSGAKINITSVTITHANGTIESETAGGPNTSNNISFAGGVATVSGLGSGDQIAWTTSAPHDRVLIEGVAGKFDIGGFAILNTSSASVDIGQQLTFEDAGPTITATATGAPTLTVDETVLTTDAPGSFGAQFTKSFGADGPAGTDSVTYALSTPGGASGLTDTATGQSVVLSLVGGQILGKTAVSGDTVFVVSVDASGNVTLDQQRAVVHANPNDPDESRGLTGSNLVVLTATVTDGDADDASAPLDLTPLLVFKDDGPSITETATGAPTLTVDETVLATDDTKAFTAQFTPTFGNDGQGATPVSYALSTPGGASGLTDTATGQSVVLSLVGGQILGKTAVSGDTVFVVSVDASGNVTLDQQRAMVHANPNDPDESRGLTGSNLVVLTATATDGDADHASAPLDLTPLLVFKDDGPSIGPIADSTVDFTKDPAGTATQSLLGVVGADPNVAPYVVTSFTPSLTINGTLLHGIASNNDTTITYFADTSGNGTFGDAGDLAFYKLELSQAANSGAGSYTFTVLVDAPPAVLTFDFNAVHPGSNLFGTVGDVNNALIVIAENPVINPVTGLFSSSPNGVIKTSQGGGPTTIGVNSQMFDPGEGAYFTYVKNPDPNYLAGAPNGLSPTEANDADNILYSGGTNTATSASTFIVQTQGGGSATMAITAFDIADSPQARDFVSGLGSGTPVNITSVLVLHANGTTESETAGGPNTSNNISFAGGIATVSGLGSGDKIAWTTSAPHDRVLIEGVGGKFDIGGFQITQSQPTPAQDLPFTVQATDGDGDFQQDSFNVHINGVVA